MKIYKVIFRTTDNELKNVGFYRTRFLFRLWDIIADARKEIIKKEKVDIHNKKWVLDDIKRIK